MVRFVKAETDAAPQEYQFALDVVIEEIANVNRRLDRLYDVIETGNLSLDDLAPRIRELKARKDNLQAGQRELEWRMKQSEIELAHAATVARSAQDLRNLLGDSSLVVRKSFIGSFVKELRVTVDKGLVNYTVALPPGKLTTEEVAVPSTKHHGGPQVDRTKNFCSSFCSCHLALLVL